MTIKERMMERLFEAKKVKVPEFKTPEQMEKFIAKMHPDATPDDLVSDPETGEIFMEPGQTKRKLAKQRLKKATPKVNPAIWINPYDSRYDGWGGWSSLGDFEKIYNVVERDYAKEVDDAEHLRKHDYDVDFRYPAAIKRKDGKAFDEFDVDAITDFLKYSNDALPGRNIKLLGKPKKGQNLLKPVVELR